MQTNLYEIRGYSVEMTVDAAERWNRNEPTKEDLLQSLVHLPQQESPMPLLRCKARLLLNGCKASRIETIKEQFTQLEKMAMLDLWISSAGNGHDFGYPDDLPTIKKVSRGGVIASLIKKGIIEFYDNCGEYPNQFKFSDKGRALFVDFQFSCLLKD